MFVYTLLIVLAIIAAVISSSDVIADQNKKIALVSCMGFAALLAACRDMIGGYDVYMYSRYFEGVLSLSAIGNGEIQNIYDYEPLYLFFNMIIKTFTDDKYVLFFVLAILSYGLLYRNVRRHEYAGLVLILMLAKFTLPSYAYLRQFLSLCILWAGLVLLEQEKPYRYLLVVIIASLFHYTAAIAAIAVFFRKKAMPIGIVIAIFTGSFILGQIGGTKILGALIGETTGSEKLTMYSLIEEESTHLLHLIECATVGIFLCIQYKRVSALTPPLYLNLLILYIATTLFTLKDPGMQRIHWFFFIGYAVSVSHFIKLVIRKEKFIIVSLILLYSTALFYKELIVRDEGSYVPYKAFFIEGEHSNKWPELD